MKILKLITIVLLLVCFANAQQLTYDWGYTTAGARYTQTGAVDLDSAATTSIVFDMQDYYPLDILPVASDDSVIILNSTRMYYGTFWYYIDVDEATDTTSVNINAYPGFMTYYSGTGDRISTTNLTFSTTATALLNESAFTANDRQWTGVNVYISNSTWGKIFPPEFIKIAVTYDAASNDDSDLFWKFVYPTVTQSEQEKRTSTKERAKKASPTLH